MNRKNTLCIIGLCLSSLLIGYAISEFVLNVQMTGYVSYSVALSFQWVSNGQEVTSYDWGDIRGLTKNMPDVWLINVGNLDGQVKWNSNEPTGLQLSIMRLNSTLNWPRNTQIPLARAEREKLKISLSDVGFMPGTFEFTLSFTM